MEKVPSKLKMAVRLMVMCNLQATAFTPSFPPPLFFFQNVHLQKIMRNARQRNVLALLCINWHSACMHTYMCVCLCLWVCIKTCLWWWGFRWWAVRFALANEFPSSIWFTTWEYKDHINIYYTFLLSHLKVGHNLKHLLTVTVSDSKSMNAIIFNSSH